MLGDFRNPGAGDKDRKKDCWVVLTHPVIQCFEGQSDSKCDEMLFITENTASMMCLNIHMTKRRRELLESKQTFTV